MKNCQLCHCVAYCSDEHAFEDLEEHSKSCSFLKTALMDYAKKQSEGLARYWKPRPKLLWYVGESCTHHKPIFVMSI